MLRPTLRALAAVGALLVVSVVSACAAPAPADDDPIPSFVVTPSTPEPADALPADGASMRAWADIALPASRPGGSTATTRDVRTFGAGRATQLALTQPAGRWTITLACQSADGSPVRYDLVSAGSSTSGETIECSAPGGAQPRTVSVLYVTDGTEATMTLHADTDAVVAYEIAPYADAAS